MKSFKYTIPLLLFCSVVSADKLMLVQMPSGQYIAARTNDSGSFSFIGIFDSVQTINSPDPTTPPVIRKIDRVTYVYEKDQGIVPRPVSFALRKLNEQGIVATSFEVDSVTGTGSVPRQDAVAVKAAKENGLPCLIVQSGGTVAKVVKSPATEEQVLEAVK